jgi:hypothetical protein
MGYPTIRGFAYIDSNRIVRMIHVPGAQVTLEDAKETMAAYLKLNKGKRPSLFPIVRINMRLPPVSI